MISNGGGQAQYQRHEGVGQGQGLPQGYIFFGKVALIGVVQGNQYDILKLFPDSQDHLGQAQHQRHQGVGQGEGLLHSQKQKSYLP